MNTQNSRISLSKVGGFPKLFTDYISKQNPELSDFFDIFPDLEGFRNQIAETHFHFRNELVDALKKQYEGTENPPEIDIFLDEKTFCVTTGHQLNIFTGPLYVIFKIISTINLAKRLKGHFPEYNFVPVYWMATEDHDFAEISGFNLFGQKHVWETSQTGAVGRFELSGIKDILEKLPDLPEVFKKAYSEKSNLAAAVRCYFHALFGHEGLVCIDGDDPALKKLFIPVIKKDILENASENIVKSTSDKLESLGYKTQIHARNINFFYLKDNLRERIEKEGDNYKVLNSDISFSESEINIEIENHPERFSPNVVLRPVYQEVILPNLAYLGGPSEVAYWLQLGDLFHHFEQPFPIVMPRNFGLVINPASQKRIDKLGLTVEELFESENILKADYVKKNSENTLDFSEENTAISEVFEKITAKAVKVDPTLKAVVEGEKTKLLNAIGNIEKRLKKSEERNFETGINQILGLKEKFFPGGGLQERTENFLNYYINDPEFLDKVKTAFDPLNFEFNIIKT
ncbi:MAG: bacillithiol biosynthesis cysteine-adding enzyme BshC [Bacteroidetes bacterium]|nr:bacillithiol biosynthesis cysteine-adding enzyme BshC [Bacteroidota bacterium]